MSKPLRFTHRPAKLAAILTLCALTATLASCAAPKIDLRKAELTKLTTKGLQLGISLSVLNPNNYNLPLKNLGWKLDLFNGPFTDGAINLNKQIAANRTTAVAFSIPALFSRARLGIQKFVAGQNIPWGFDGKANFQTPAGPVYVKFADKGVWANPLKGIDLRSLGISQADPTQPDLEPTSQPLKIELALGQLSIEER